MGPSEPRIPALVIVILAETWGFIALASEVMEKETHGHARQAVRVFIVTISVLITI